MAGTFPQRDYGEFYKLCRCGGFFLPAGAIGGICRARPGHRSGMDRRRKKESDRQQFRRTTCQRLAGALAVRVADADSPSGEVAVTHPGSAMVVICLPAYDFPTNDLYASKRFGGWFVRTASEMR